MRFGRVLIGLIIAAISGIMYFSNTQVNPVTGEKQRVALTPEQEIALGVQSAPQMAEQFGGLFPNAAVQAYVKEVGRRVVAASAAKNSPYQFDFHVLRDPQTINAFALPGGQIFITAALLKKLQNEAQLAGVLGHEVGHVIGRHSAEQMAKARLTQGLVGAAGVAGSSDYSSGQTAAMIANMVGSMVNMRFGREDELESDRLGVHYMVPAGYDPRALKDVMRILAESRSGSPQPEFLSTHPDPGNRTQRIEEEISKAFSGAPPANLSLGDSGLFRRMQAEL